jgi:hypothetical protein
VEVVRISDEVSPAPGPAEEPARSLSWEATAPRLVLVTWRDAWFDFDQSNDDRADYLVSTVGFVVGEDPRFVSVAQEVLPDGDGFRAVTHIPRSVVESIVPLSSVQEPTGLYSEPGAEVAPDRRRDA